jgi:glycosyltransferase involved in cell wall biosynthesis
MMDISDFINSNKDLKTLWEDPKWRLIDMNISDVSSFRFQKIGSNQLKTIIVDTSIQHNNIVPITDYAHSKPAKKEINLDNKFNEAVYFGKIMDKYLEDIRPQDMSQDGKIKLAIIDNSFSIGGAVWSIVLLLKHLDKSKVYPRVYSGRRSEITDYLSKMGIEVIICPSPNFRDSEAFGDWIADSLQEWGPDIVDGAWSVHWGFHRFREFVPLVVAHAQATEVPWLDETIKAEYCPFDQKLIDDLDGIICVAQAVYDNYPLIQNKSIVIPSPIDTKMFEDNHKNRASVRNNLNIDQDAFVVAWVGRISEQKRPDLLLEIVDRVSSKTDGVIFLAAAWLPNYFAKHPMAQNWLDGLDSRPIIWVPDMKPYHAPVLYSAADVFLLNSDWEGLSLTSLEALAAGVPVICTDVSGQREVIRDGDNGFLCPKGDVEALADAIIAFSKMDVISRNRFTENAKRSVQDIDAKINADKTLEFYQKLMERNHE